MSDYCSNDVETAAYLAGCEAVGDFRPHSSEFADCSDRALCLYTGEVVPVGAVRGLWMRD
jgi:hypothetical protein